MTERENALLVYNHKIPEWIPSLYESFTMVGLWGGNECGSLGEEIAPGIRKDSWGVPWDFKEGITMPFPAAGYKPILTDIEKWREQVKFPQPENWDWETIANTDLHVINNYDGTTVLTYFNEQGLFDRLTALMGFEEALMALITNPDEVKELFEEIVDYKIKMVELANKYYNPDVFMYTDDIAKSDGLFMNPEVYREIIKPYHARIVQAIRDNGMIAEQHTCGKCEAVIGDYVEIGIQSFFPAQSSNDLVAIKRKYGDKLVICGGFDTQGPAGHINVSEETMRAEVRREIDEYAKGGGYISMPIILGSDGFAKPVLPTQQWFFDEFKKYSKDYYSKPLNRVQS